MMEHDEDVRLSKEILTHFLSHPKAADSLEGIVRWRLLEERISRTEEETRRAIEWLTQAGFLFEITTASEATFRLNEQKRPAAEAFVGVEPRQRKHTA